MQSQYGHYLTRRVSLDRGGTFTDCVCKVPGGKDIIVKILSVDPSNYDDAPTEAIRKTLEIHTGRKIARGSPMDLSSIGDSFCLALSTPDI